MQIPTYKRQSVTPQPMNTVMEQPDFSKEQAMQAWAGVIGNDVNKSVAAVGDVLQKQEDFKRGLAKDEMNSNAQQALDGLKDELNKKDPKELFLDGSFDDYKGAYEQAMAKAHEKSTGKMKGQMKNWADRYWQQLESANRDIARQIYDKAQKEAGAYCAGQDLQSAVADCDQARANESIDNAVGAGYMTWQEGDKLKQDAKYDIFINGVISGKPFEYEKKNGDKVAVNHQVGLDHDADLKMLEQAREELPNDKYNQLKSYVNNLWQVKADQIQSDRGNEYIDLYKRIMDGDKTVTMEYIDNDPALDPVNLDGCQTDYRSRLRTLWKQMNPEEKKTRTNEHTKDNAEGLKPPTEQEIKNFITLAKTRFEKGEINGKQFMKSVADFVNTGKDNYYSASELVVRYGAEITETLPKDYQPKAKITMDSITEGLQSLVDKDSKVAPELQLENLKEEAMEYLLDVIYEFSDKEGRKEEFDKACSNLMAIYTTKALSQQEKLAKEPTKKEKSSIPAALEKMGEFEEYGDLLYFNNFTGENVWLNRKAGNAFEKAADVAASGISDIMGRDVQWHYSSKDKPNPNNIYFQDEYGFKYRIIDKKIYKENSGNLEQVWPSKLEEAKKEKQDKEENEKAKDVINSVM